MPTRTAVSIIDRFRGERVLLTGVTGFLAKSVLEKMLRAIGGVERVYLLVRPRQTAGAAERVEREVISSSIFDRLRHAQGDSFVQLAREKISPVEGDLGEERLGLSQQTYAELAGSVTCIINSAAACSFGEQLDRALQVNTIGPQRILQLAKDAGNIPLLHVSTCYVNGAREGDVPEEVLPLGHTVTTFLKGARPHFDVDREVQSMIAECADIRAAVAEGERDDEVFADAYRSIYASDRIAGVRQDFADSAVVDLGKRLARSHGWTDTYPFTKALGEQLLVRERGDVPLVILRPSIIESSYEEPVPGWIDGMRMADPLITEVGNGNLLEFVGRPQAKLDLIPCDMVANAILAAVPKKGEGDCCTVYHVGSSDLNPLTVGRLSQVVYEAFSRRPAHDRRGHPLPAAQCRWIPGTQFKTRLLRRMRQLRLMRDLYTRIGAKDRARSVHLKLRVLGRSRDLAELYGFYTSSSPRFLANNTRALRESLSPDERAMFPFDVTCIDWHDYIVERHVPGLHRMTSTKNGSKQAINRRVLRRISGVRCAYDLFERAADLYGESTATQVCRGDRSVWIRYTFRQLVEAAAHTHAQLADHGVQAGDRVVIYSESNPEWAIAYLALQRAGLVAVPLDPQLTGPQVCDIAQHADAKLILVGRRVGRRAHNAMRSSDGNGSRPPIVRLEGPFVPDPQVLPTAYSSGAPPKKPRLPEDAASMIFANGSTRPPTGTVLSHDAFLADVRSILGGAPSVLGEGTISMPRMHDDVDFSRRFVSALASGACVSYVD